MTTRFQVLSCGPSLARAQIAPRFDGVRIGVNNAATRHVCDWWVYGDLESFGLWSADVKHRPQTFCAGEVLDRMARRSIHRPCPVMRWEDVDCGCPAQWRVFSITAALVLAWRLGAQHVEVIGADMHGPDDFTGRTHAARGEQRWQAERALFASVTDWLFGQGVIVHHVKENEHGQEPVTERAIPGVA